MLTLAFAFTHATHHIRYPPALAPLIAKRKNFKQLEDFNKEADDVDKKYNVRVGFFFFFTSTCFGLAVFFLPHLLTILCAVCLS